MVTGRVTPPGSRTAGPTRRRILGGLGLALGAGLGGCGDEDPGPGLYASNAEVIHRRGDDRFDYPEDVAVRVTIENTTPDRQRGVLRTTLEHLDDSGETPAVVGSWTDEREISISRGTSRAVLVVFENVLAGDEDSYALRARASIAYTDGRKP